MFGLGIQEIAIIGVIVLLLFGGKKIPELLGGLGSGIKEFKKGLKEISDPVNEAKKSINDSMNEVTGGLNEDLREIKKNIKDVTKV